MNIKFRPLEENDLKQMHLWLNTDFVTRWWKPPMTLENVETKYGAYIRGEKPTKPYIIMINDQDIGYIQTYYYSDYPGEYYEALEAHKYSAGVDLFIGHKDFIHKGYGIHIMQAFINKYVFSNPDVFNIIITPEPDNIMAIKVYTKVGFEWYKTINTSNGESEYLMVLSKENYKLKNSRNG